MERRNFLKTASGALVAGITPLAGFGFSSAEAYSPAETDAHTAKPELKFRENGRFRILQLTDIHFRTNVSGGDSALELMRRAIGMVQPDLIMVTGDMVLTPDTAQAWKIFSGVLSEAKIPWAVVFGNHDQEFELTKPQIIDILSKQPYNLTENGPTNISGNSNYILQIRSSKSPKKTKAALYCFDSRREQTLVTPLAAHNFDWIDFNQIDWYRKQSSLLTSKNGGEPLPALAFFHIPLPEYKEIIGQPGTVGIQWEKVCSPPVNSGLFTSICEHKDVMGMFVGHDHNNNYIGCLHNICLGYGYASGRQTYGDIGRGVRVIELLEDERKFDTWLLKLYDRNTKEDTWIPVEQVEPLFPVTYPDSFKI
jgi:hypothetical protein